MTSSPSDNPSQDRSGNAPSSNRSRPIATQACDACRGRRAKCEMTSRYHSLISPTSRDIETSTAGNGTRQCRRCVQLGLECTFLLPSKVRGPRRKRNLITGRVSISSILQPSGSEPNRSSPLPVLSNYVESSTSHVRHSMPSESNGIVNAPISQRLWHNPPERLVDLPHPALSYRTDSLCSRALLKQILADYLAFLYPMIPVVHKPSFRRGLAIDRDSYDDDFLAVTVCLCAATCGTMPSRFRHYQSLEPLACFQNRTELVNRCHQIVMQLRGPDYFDEINLQKWAASYLLSIAFFQIGQRNRCRMLEVEAMQLARLLEVHRISRYRGLNSIEAQLRKKAFWLMFYIYVHDELQNLRKERLAFLDESTLSSINLEELMPLEIDDEMILEHEVLSDDSGQIPLTAGFNLHSSIFWTAVKDTAPRIDQGKNNGCCKCVRSGSPKLQLAHLRGRLNDLKYMLDGVPPQLRPWAVARDECQWLTVDERERAGMMDSMRANIHVTHLWLQSTILDHIDALLLSEPHLPSPVALQDYDAKTTWAEKEDICRQLLHILHSIPEINLESNGHHLTFKVRDVAVTLLSCPFEPHEDAAKRAHEYLLAFTDKLSQLDGSEILSTTNLQSWVDSARSPEDE